jgi:hypothetical protein
MTETAVGLFDQVGHAQEVVEALRRKGFPATGIRVVSASSGVSDNNTISNTPSDFSASVSRDFKGMGANEHEAALYLSRLHGGNALVFATGDSAQVGMATDVMNDFSAIEIEEFAGAAVGAPSRRASSGTVVSAERTPGVAEPSSEATATRNDPNATAKIEHHRHRTEGARIFAW